MLLIQNYLQFTNCRGGPLWNDMEQSAWLKGIKNKISWHQNSFCVSGFDLFPYDGTIILNGMDFNPCMYKNHSVAMLCCFWIAIIMSLEQNKKQFSTYVFYESCYVIT